MNLSCATLPGGYCASACGVTGSACDGACVELGRIGEVCVKPCTADADCRVDEGYVCDRQWRACLVPNVAAPVAKQCPGRGPARATAFADSEPLSTSASPGVYQLAPTAVLTDDGDIVALYASRSEPGAPVRLGLSRREGAGALATAGPTSAEAQPRSILDVPFAANLADARAPRLTRDRKGTLYAAWLAGATETAPPQLLLASSTDRGATWTAPVAVHDPDDCASGARDCPADPMIAVGVHPRTKAEVLYVMYAAGEHGLRVRASRDGGATFTSGPIALGGSYGNATTSADGRLHLVAIEGGPLGAYGSAHQQIAYAVSDDAGDTFRTPVRVSAPDEVLPYFFANPSIVADDRRRWLYVAYVRGGRDAAWDIVLAASKDGGKTWQRKTLAGDGCAIHMVPNLAIDPSTGTLHVAYYDSEGAPGRFVHATCGPGLAKCTIHGAINSLPFAALSTAQHTSRWVGERQALLVDARRRVVHAIWGQTIDEAGQPITRIFHAAAKLKK